MTPLIEPTRSSHNKFFQCLVTTRLKLYKTFLNPFPKRQIFRIFQTQRLCRHEFQIWWKWQKVFQTCRKHWGKRRNRKFLFFPRCVQNTYTADMWKPRLVWERVKDTNTWSKPPSIEPGFSNYEMKWTYAVSTQMQIVWICLPVFGKEANCVYQRSDFCAVWSWFTKST